VAADSQVETFAAVRLHIDTWRWAGVPFYIRAGKCLPITATEVIVDLKCPPLAIFDEIQPAISNYFRFRLSPEVVISVGTRVKRVGEEMRGEPVELIARHEPLGEKPPYARLLGDAIRGDTSLFTRDDCVEAAWRVVAPVLDNANVGYAHTANEYEPGTWGPAAAARVVTGEEGWHDPVAEKTTPC
jgi:glucose-6-phosphate 1-dehydrogenase